MSRLFVLAMFIMPVDMAYCQTSLFEQMTRQLDAASLPLVNLIVDTGRLNNRNYMDGVIEIADYKRRTDPGSLSVRYRCKIRYRGSSALRYGKKSFAVKLTDENGGDLDACILGIREENSWILDAMAIDRIRMRNRVCFDLWNQMSRTPYDTKYDGRNGTAGEFVEVFVNGEYHGLYCLTDKVDRKLLGLKKAKEGNDGSVDVRGLLYKGISWESASDLLSYEEAGTDTVSWNAWELTYPDDYPSADTWQPLMDLIDFCSEKTDDRTFQEEWETHFHKGNLVDYMVFTLALNVRDNGYKNMYLSCRNIEDGQQFLITPWDMDASLGGNWNGERLDGTSHLNRYDGIGPYNRLHKENIDDFTGSLRETWGRYGGSVFSPANVERILDGYARRFMQSGAWQREYEKWNGNPVPLEASPETELAYVKEWYRKNHAHLSWSLGVSTGIGHIAAEVADKETQLYTIDGRKIDSSGNSRQPKGFYIMRGKVHLGL